MTGIAGAEGRSRVTAIIFFGIALTSLGAPQVLLNAGGAAYLLTYHGVELLPATYIGAAILMIPAIWALTLVARRADAATILIGATLIRIAAAAALFAAAALGYGEVVGIAAPVWIRVDMVIGLMTVWRLAGKVFGAPGDRRWLAYLAVCDPLSTFAMGVLGPVIAGTAGVASVFAIAALTLAASCPPAFLIRAQMRQEQDRARRTRRRRRNRAKLRPLSPNMRRYLILVIAAMAVWAVAHFQLDILLHGFAGARFEDIDGRFDFFAYTLAAAGAFGVAFTAFGQGRLLRAYGVRLLLVVLPVILIAAAATGLALSSIFAAPFLLFAFVTAMKVVEFALVSGFYTRAWRGLLSPLPDTHRDRLIAMVNRNVHAVGAVGGAGVGFALLTTRQFDPSVFAIAFLALSTLGLILSFLVLRGFTAALERALSRRQSIEDMELGATDRRSREVVQRMLREGAGRDAIEAARLQAALDVDGFVHMAPRLIAKGDRDVVRKLLDTVREIARPELFPPMAGRLTIEEDREVRDALMTAAAATGHPRSARLLAKSLADEPDDPPMGALIGLGRHGGLFGGAVASQFLERYALTGEDRLTRALDAAREIGPNAPTGPVAVGLQSADPAIRRKAIRAAGKIGDPTLANLVVQQLSDPRERRAATLALSAIGVGAVPAIAAAIGDREAPFAMRSAAMRALGDIAEPEATEQLLLHAESRDPQLRSAAHLALWRAGAVLPRETHAGLMDHCRKEIADAAEAALAARDLRSLDGAPLEHALRQRSLGALIAAVRAAGLPRARSHEIEARFCANFGSSRDWRHVEAGAALLPDDLRPVFRAIASGEDSGLDAIRGFARQPMRDPDDWLGHLLTDARWTTDWLRAASYHYLMRRKPEERDVISAAAEDPGPVLAAMIREANDARDREVDMALNTVEKVLILKTADLFRSVPDEDLAEIAPFLTPVYLDPGEEIITEGELGEELYIVVAGEVSVRKEGEELARRGEREVFGDLAALDPEPRSASVVAIEPTQLLSLSNEHLLALFESNVEIASGVISSLIGRLRRGEV